VDEPAFREMPSESISEPEDDGEVTVIRNKDVPPPPPNTIDDISFSPDREPSGERIIVPTMDEQPRPSAPRARVIPPYQPPAQPPNTGKIVVLTVLGTIAAMSLGAFGFWMLQGDRSDNQNVNTNFNAYLENTNTNVNTNLGLDSNFNFNLNANFNSNSLMNINTNFNTNVRTPTPTPTPRPSPSVTPTPTPDDVDTPPAPTPTRPAASPTPSMTIRPGRTPEPPRMNPGGTNRSSANRLDG
jgi:type II secretory pathway pseudopilin PulG